MKKFIILITFLTSISFYAQVGIGTTTPDASAMLDVQSNNSGLLIPRMSATERDNIASPATGLMVYVYDDNSFYYFDGTSWKKTNQSGLTMETINLANGNQTINVTNADKIVGFTLISNSHWLDSNTGRMSGTWMVNDNRDKIRCTIQTFEHPFMKYLIVSVYINNADNQIEISNYTSRYWKVTEALPQNSLSNHQNAYQLGQMVIIRKE